VLSNPLPTLTVFGSPARRHSRMARSSAVKRSSDDGPEVAAGAA
jgi:hypothetical protein